MIVSKIFIGGFHLGCLLSWHNTYSDSGSLVNGRV